MPDNKPSSFNWTKAFALIVLVAGTLLFFYRFFSPPLDWEGLRKSAIEQYQLGNLQAAERHLLSALKVAEQYPENDPRFHQALRDLVEIYNLQSKFSEAEAVILRLIALDEKLLGGDHPNVAASLNNLAENYRIRGETEKADSAYRRSIEILEKTFGADHELVAHVREGYYRFLKQVGKPVPENAQTRKAEPAGP